MSDLNGGMSPKDKQYLDMALEGKSDAFKVKVYEIVRLFKLDASDPAFLMMIGTGRLEVLLEEFPEQFEAVFRRELEAVKRLFRDIQNWMTQEKREIKGYLEGLEAMGDRYRGEMSEVVTDLKTFSAQQQQQSVQAAAGLITLANQERDEIKTQVDQHIQASEAQYRNNLSAKVPEAIQTIGKLFKPLHVRQLIGTVTLSGMLVFGLGICNGWLLHQWNMGELDPAGKRQLSLKQWESLQWAVSSDGQLAKNILDWNGSTIAECQNGQGPSGEKLHMVTSDDERPIKFGNCNLWVVPPGKREFGPKPSQ